MADFCKGCTEGDYQNDFHGVVPEGRFFVGLCEGCGTHLFDHKGEKQCDSPSWYDDPENVKLFGCEECQSIIDRMYAEEYGDQSALS